MVHHYEDHARPLALSVTFRTITFRAQGVGYAMNPRVTIHTDRSFFTFCTDERVSWTVKFLLVSQNMKNHKMIGLGDMEEAFFQGKRAERLMFVEQTQGRHIFGLPQGPLLRLEVEVHWTVRGSANWRETIRQYILLLVYVQTRADPCAFIFKPETNVNPKQLQNPFHDSEWLTSADAEGEG